MVIYNLCYKSQIKSHSPPPALNGAVLDARTQALSINLAGTYAAAVCFLTLMHSKQDRQNRLLWFERKVVIQTGNELTGMVHAQLKATSRLQEDSWSVDTWTFVKKRKQYKYDIQATGIMTKERKSDLHSCSHQTSHWHAAFLVMNTSAKLLNYSPARWNKVNCALFGARDFILLREQNYFYQHFSRPALDVSAPKDKAHS